MIRRHGLDMAALAPDTADSGAEELAGGGALAERRAKAIRSGIEEVEALLASGRRVSRSAGRSGPAAAIPAALVPASARDSPGQARTGAGPGYACFA